MGPITIFDKSFLQSLSVDESVLFDKFFMPVICPIFFIETLADLEKQVRRGRTPEQEVGIIADKVPEMSGYPCAFHIDMGVASLFGSDPPLDGRIPQSGGRPVMVDGKAGFVYNEPAEAEALRRWQNREFLAVERRFASAWREVLNRIDLQSVAESIRHMGVSERTCKSLEDAKRMSEVVIDSASSAVTALRLCFNVLGIPPQNDFYLFGKWAREGRGSLSAFAPYAAHLSRVELFFQIALAAKLITTSDRNNRTDIAYIFYSPFCHVFVSSDKLHRRCAPLFLRPDQSFVWGPELKADLARLVEYYSDLPDEEKQKGLLTIAPHPPAEDDGVSAGLWDRHMRPEWRDRSTEIKRRDVDADAALVAHIDRVAEAPATDPGVGDFSPEAIQFVQIQRRISRKKGQFWLVPKDVQG